MTAVEFEALGGRVEHTWKGPRVLAPKGRLDVAIALRAEVARRISMTRELAPIGEGDARYGVCELCGDAMPHYVSGMCCLCGLARYKGLVALGKIAA